MSVAFLLTTLVVAAATGLAALMHASALAFQGLKYAGVAYLLFLAWTTLRDKGRLGVDAVEPSSVWRTIRQAVLLNLLNPKLTIFFVAFLPQFVHPDEPNALWHMLGLSSVFMLVTLVVFAGYGVFAAAMRTRVLARPCVLAWLRRSFTGSYVLLAGRLAVTDR